MSFSHFDLVDRILAEPRVPYVRADGAVWPSEASAVALPVNGEEHHPATYYGKCHRAAFLSMAGFEQTNPASPLSQRRMRLGLAIEQDQAILARQAGIFAAAQVKSRRQLPDGAMLPIVLDIVMVDPRTFQGCIFEMKSIYGYGAGKKVFRQKRPKPENLMQIAIYLDQIKDGTTLKELVRLNLIDLLRAMRSLLTPEDAEYIEAARKRETESSSLDALANTYELLRMDFDAKRPAGRIPELTFDAEKILSMGDGPLMAKLAYESRDDGRTGEFDISIHTDPDGKRYPAIDGYPYRLFSLDSVYKRYSQLSVYWRKHWEQVQSKLTASNIDTSHPGYRQQLIQISQRLAPNNLPPAEYEFRYASDKVEDLRERGVIGKTKYTKWKKGTQLIGDWNCAYCSYMSFCVPLEYPDLRMMAQEMVMEDEEEEAA